MQLCNVTIVKHPRQVLHGDANGERFDLAGPQRHDPVVDGSKREASNSVKETSHRDDPHFTACTTVRVILTAVCAVYTADIILARVVVSKPKAPAMRGISPAESIRPKPSRA